MGLELMLMLAALQQPNLNAQLELEPLPQAFGTAIHRKKVQYGLGLHVLAWACIPTYIILL